MLSNVVRVLRISTRSILASLVDLNRSQLLKSNRSLNRLLDGLSNSDLNDNLTVSRLRSKGLLTLTQNGLAVLLGNQLSEQSVFLTRNQTLIGHRVLNLCTSNNLSRTLSKVGLRGNLYPTRQTRLVNRNYSLTKTIANTPVAVRTNNGDKGISRLTVNSHRRVNFKPSIKIELVTRIADNPESCEGRELVLITRKSRKAVGLANSLPSYHLNSLCATSSVRDQGSQVNAVIRSKLLISRLSGITKLHRHTNRSVLILRVVKAKRARRRLVIFPIYSHRILGCEINAPGPTDVIASLISFRLPLWYTSPHQWTPSGVTAIFHAMGAKRLIRHEVGRLSRIRLRPGNGDHGRNHCYCRENSSKDHPPLSGDIP